jgi:hypothetical protein
METVVKRIEVFGVVVSITSLIEYPLNSFDGAFALETIARLSGCPCTVAFKAERTITVTAVHVWFDKDTGYCWLHGSNKL